MKRILHAAARGARIQVLSQSALPQWWATLDFSRAHHQYRIHPKDAALEYGPVSTELRQRAERIQDATYLQDVLGFFGYAAVESYLSGSDEFGACWHTAMNAPAIQKALFLLILAESLAEGGL